MNYFSPKMDVLPEAQKGLWSELGFAKELGFVLYGGTAIALQLGHRVSVDFDFFSDKPLDRDFILSQSFFKNITLFQNKEDSLSFSVHTEKGDVNVSFFGNINTGRITDPLMTEDGVLVVASLDELLATKLKTVQQRIERKDFVDIIALLKDNHSLVDGLKNATALYGNSFSPVWCLKTLVYFDDDLALTNEEKHYLEQVVESCDLQKLHDMPLPQKEPNLSVDIEPNLTL